MTNHGKTIRRAQDEARLERAIAAAEDQPVHVQMVQANLQLPSGLPAIVALPKEIRAEDVLAIVEALPRMYAELVAARPTSRIVLPRT